MGGPFLYQHNWGYVMEPAPGEHIYTPADGDSIVVIKNVHDPREFFTLEARKNSTPGNSLFPVPVGLLIWHSDLKVHTHNTLEDGTRYAHYKHSIVQMDGLYELEQSGSNPPINSGDVYLPGDEFSDLTTPDARWWSGEPSGIQVKDIVLIGDAIQFTVVIPEIHVEHADIIPKADWTLVSQTPSQAGYDGTKAFDGDVGTYFHVPWGSSAPRPHELMIDLGTAYDITEFYYTANDNYSPPREGRIKDYELSFSMDGLEWGTPVVSEQFFQTPYRQYALFPSKEARYVRFSAINSWLDDVRTSVAEIDFRGKPVDVSSTEDGHSAMALSMTLSPNPVSGLLKIEGVKEASIIRIMNHQGVVHSELKCMHTTTWLDMSDFPEGIWLIEVYQPDGKWICSDRVVKINR
ncbi:MAG: discoidin domain-containing protein [Saprospiraceae bacterium]|nr:discoidin domain-containing protein [Saprospiraceae bacterium]